MKADAAEEIIRKCEQYYNEQHLEPPEMHAILEFINIRAYALKEAIALLRRVSAEGQDMPSGWMIPGDLYWAIENLLEGGDEG